GSSLLAPLRKAEREINHDLGFNLQLAAYNFGAPFPENEWRAIENDLMNADVVFVIHVMDGENANRLLPLLDRRPKATVVINCMPALMKRTRMGKLNLARLTGISSEDAKTEAKREDDTSTATGMLASISSWIGKQARGNGGNGSKAHSRAEYLKWAA